MVSKAEKVIFPNTKFYVLSLFFIIGSDETIRAQTYDIEALFALINERLTYMEHVALYKERAKSPIEDMQREAIVINDAVRNANELGLFGPSVESFFKIQINVAKAIQYRYRADWLSTPPTFIPLDLQQVIRPKLSELGESIVKELATLYLNDGRISEEHRSLFHDAINTDNVSLQDKTRLFDSLLTITAQK